MLLSLLSKEDKNNFIDLLRQLFLIDGEASDVEKLIQKKFEYELAESDYRYRPSSKKKDELIAIFSDKSNEVRKLVYMNLLQASLDDQWYTVEQHELLDEIQKSFDISNKTKVELMKIVYSVRDIREKAKRAISK